MIVRRRPTPRAAMLFLLLALLLSSSMQAHSMYQSAVLLDFTGSQLQAELQLPLERVSSAFGRHISSSTLEGQRNLLTPYVLSRFLARTTDGRPFQTRLSAPLTVATIDGVPYLLAHLSLIAPPGAAADLFVMQDNVILDALPSQVALVSIRSDWKTSVFANDPQLVGVLRSSERSLTVNRSGASWLHGFASIGKLGVRHIAEGTDHLLFLLALLLPAPLLFCRSRWSAPAGVRRSLLRIVKVVSAFTLGHSISLASAALGFVHVPSRPIEVLIAVSILISAIHALRPIFPGREAAIAAFFGLVHGLAFATTLVQLGLSRWERVAGIFAFNLGIEAMQLLVVLATLPSLILLSRTRAYSAVRISGALFAALASSAWIAERLFGKHTSVDLVVEAIAHQSLWIATSLLLLSLLLWRSTNRNHQTTLTPERLS